MTLSGFGCLAPPSTKLRSSFRFRFFLEAQRNKASVMLLRRRNKGACVPTVHLLRHGRHADVGCRLTGRGQDGGLTAAGEAEVRQSAERLAGAPPTAIFASPRRRTLETAALLGSRFGLTVTIADALDEIDFGDWTGRSFEELDRDPRWTEWNTRRGSARCPGGESQAEAQARALAFAFEAASAEERPLLVTHCDIVRALVCWSQRRPLDDIHSVSCEPASLTELDLLHVRAAA
jgi:broad specificity phosphatase PhoE